LRKWQGMSVKAHYIEASEFNIDMQFCLAITAISLFTVYLQNL